MSDLVVLACLRRQTIGRNSNANWWHWLRLVRWKFAKMANDWLNSPACTAKCTTKESPLIHLWSDERNLTRRLLRVKERNPNRILLEVQRFGKTKPGQLEFLLRDNSRPAGRVTREQFRARFARILAEKFLDSMVESLTSSPDLEHSFSGL
jgi:hypothetical protein